jgi:hypothetical protein
MGQSHAGTDEHRWKKGTVSRAPVKRVVLDSNYFRSLKAGDILTLRERSFSVSVSASAIYEIRLFEFSED